MKTAKVKFEVRRVIADGLSMLDKEFTDSLKAIRYAERLTKKQSGRIYVKQITSELIWQNTG